MIKLDLSNRGIVKRERHVLEVRDLTRADIPTLHEPRQPVPAAKRLRDPHHRLARLFAMGLRRSQIIKRGGYSSTRVDSLSKDPAFIELVAKYRAKVDEEWAEAVDDYAEIATSNMLKAEIQLAERLEAAEEEGELLPVKELIAISRDAADRFGYGKKQTNLNINVDFAAKLEAARARAAKVISSIPAATSPAGGVVQSPATTEPPQALRRRA